jgi:spore coat protein A
LSHTRRTFLQQVAAFSVASTAFGQTARALAQHQMSMPNVPDGRSAIQQQLPKMLHNLELTPFVDPMPVPVAARPDSRGHLRIAMREIYAKVHRDVAPTRMWSYGSTALAPLIEARSGVPLQVEWINQLPAHHFLPVDFSLHGCGHDVPEVRACVHVHGGRTPSESDGYPEDWYVPGKSRVCRYPFEQDAATLWYHDHAMGLNLLNMYAGLIGTAIVRDKGEDALGLPSGKYEVPIQLYDRNFSADGQLFYPESGIPGHPWVSEFEGDAILLNGKIRPYFKVEPRMYRFRLLNTANSRFFNLSLSDKSMFHQIGSDQGLLSAPLMLPRIFIAPAERADVLIDFSAMAGTKLHLLNSALPVLEFRVAKEAGGKPAYSLPTKLRAIERTPASSAILTRQITIDEAVDHIGNSMLMYLNKKRWHELTTEFPKLNTTEIWEFINLTEDVHPLHLHMVRFQILDRRLFDVFAYRNYKGMHYISDPLPPEPNEMGWKDVAQCPREQVTRIIVNFDGYAGKYLYHCHILEHEANDMMRPFEVVA